MPNPLFHELYNNERKPTQREIGLRTYTAAQYRGNLRTNSEATGTGLKFIAPCPVRMEGAKKNFTLSAARSFLVLAVYLAAITAVAAAGPAAGFALCAPNSQDQRRADMCSMRALPARAGLSKVLHLVRHGQAAHNVRAEPARHAGCSYDEFLELMRLDDAFDAGL